ncbi:hypothetical protein [Cupriavidus sp. WS]|uniref:hypothetical protein n=1 Tax=Cupriavidus sp. WS TaxID=1312922 RepID=UPI00036949C8|nr:hypothetical protein [Cupriavidus sp. WS]
MRSVRFAAAVMATAVLVWPGLQALADPLPDGPSAAVPAADSASAANTGAAVREPVPPAGGRGVFAGLGKPVASNRLDGIRGGSELVANDMRLAGTVADNSASHIMSGANSIADGSFASAAGLPTVIQNSGSNVLIQNATIINVQFKP